MYISINDVYMTVVTIDKTKQTVNIVDVFIIEHSHTSSAKL